jgi:hypothetical protein
LARPAVKSASLSVNGFSTAGGLGLSLRHPLRHPPGQHLIAVPQVLSSLRNDL